jgi:hypothetical protein
LLLVVGCWLLVAPPLKGGLGGLVIGEQLTINKEQLTINK